MKATKFFSRRLRYKDVVTLAEQVLPSLEGIRNILEAISPLPSSMKIKLLMDIMLRINKIFDQLDSSEKWNELKVKWPEAREGPVVTSGDVSVTRSRPRF